MRKVETHTICARVIDSVVSEVEIINGQAYVPFDKVCDAICEYFEEDSVRKALWERQRYYFNYIRKTMKNKDFGYIGETKIKDFVEAYVPDDETFEEIKQELSISQSWAVFWERMEKKFNIW